MAALVGESSNTNVGETAYFETIARFAFGGVTDNYTPDVSESPLEDCFLIVTVLTHARSGIVDDILSG